MSKLNIILTTGLAMFSMFFGSGNLVFPLKLGMQAGDQYAIASIGLVISGVIMPFLGLFSMIIYHGNKKEFFGLIGKWAPFWLSLIMLSLMGPFGVIPRCMIVAYGGINLLYPNLSFIVFSSLFLTIIALIIWQKNKLVPIIGKFLGPFKISFILLIIVLAIYKSNNILSSNVTDNQLLSGLYEGYQTMDLLAAFFFSIIIIEYLRSNCSNEKETIKISILSTIVGAVLIAAIYIGFVILGSHYSTDLVSIKPEQYLAKIAKLTLGDKATLVFAITICLSCLTTAATLTKLFSDFIHNDISTHKISWPISIFITVAISFTLSLTGFAVISKFLGIILEIMYPSLVLLAIMSIINKYKKIMPIKTVFWLSAAISCVFRIF